MFVWMKLPVEDADAFIKEKARAAKVRMLNIASSNLLSAFVTIKC